MKACKTVLGFLAVSVAAATPSLAGPTTLEYGDGKADGKKSIGGNGEMIEFTLPPGPELNREIKGLRIHGSRYGYPKPPKEDFYIFIMNEDLEITHTESAPYSLFERGEEEWVKVRFKKPVSVPSTFWVVLDFKAHQTKGVYVSYDTSTAGTHSKVGLPGKEPRDVDFKGDWMVQVDVAR